MLFSLKRTHPSSSTNVPEPLITDIFHGRFGQTMLNISPQSPWTTLNFIDKRKNMSNLFTIREPREDPVLSSSQGNIRQWMTRFAINTFPKNVLGNHKTMRSNTGYDPRTHLLAVSGPLRLFDCETEVLKDQRTYLRQTKGRVPPYLVVSQVWGSNQVEMTLPTIPWTVPISEKEKWEVILGFCKNHDIRWLWLDVLCINQDKSEKADREKAIEIPKMGKYYREAATCLVVPQKYNLFSSTHQRLIEILHTIVDAGGLSKTNVHRVWQRLEDLAEMMEDSWLQRMWTFQELLLPRKHVLLDGQELRLDNLRRTVEWYFKVVRNGSLTRPSGGRHFDFVSEPQGNIIRGRTPDKYGWLLKESLEMEGRVALIQVVSHTRDKQCSFQADRLFGLYGLLDEEEKVTIETNMVSSQGPNSASSDTFALEHTWKRMVCKAVLSGRVWPLLNGVMNMDPTAEEGTNWIPQITAFHRRADSVTTYPKTINHRNSRTIIVGQDGLHMSVRGEIDRVITCIWALAVRGYNIEPITKQVKDGIAESDGVLRNEVEKIQCALDRALRAETLSGCFRVVSEFDLRRCLAWAPCLSGWDRTILLMRVVGRPTSTPLVLLAWTHRQLVPIQCWILDVTDDPIISVQRWVVANKVGPKAFRKIGSVQSFPAVTEEHSLVTTNIVFT